MAAGLLSAAATLDLWQAAEGLPPVERALALAAAAGDPVAADELARLPLGRRDARVLELHGRLGLRSLDATATCPACGEAAELSIAAADLLAAEGAPPAPVRVGGVELEWRQPDSLDVAAAAAAGDVEAAERVLLRRCVSGSAEPTPEQRAALARAMSDCDPLVEVLLDVACPACGHAFAADLDVAEVVWTELRRRAVRLLREVDALARAYGWTEPEVLALGDRRRHAYLDLLDEAVP